MHSPSVFQTLPPDRPRPGTVPASRPAAPVRSTPASPRFPGLPPEEKRCAVPRSEGRPAPLAREEDGFLRPLVGSRVRVSGTFGTEWHGLLLAVTKFEIRLELADGSRPVVLKHAIASVTPVEEVTK